MNVLHHLQLSCVNQSKNFILLNDSNFNVCYTYVKNSKGHKHFVLIPDRSRCVNYYAIKAMENENFQFIECDSAYTTDVFSSRFYWDHEYLKDIILENRIDVIWENNPTLVVNWKVILLEMKLPNVKVITYNHWIDTFEHQKIDECLYQLRQAEGAWKADKVFCNSEFAKDQIRKQTRLIDKDVSLKIFPIAPLVDDIEIERCKVEKEHDPTYEIQIVYNHRLSSLGYYNDAFKTFLKSLENIKTSKRIKVIFTDVSGKVLNHTGFIQEIKKKHKLDIEFQFVKLDKKQYYEMLWEADICVGSFVEGNGGCWSMSLAEGILTECATIIPEHSGYAEMVYRGYEFFTTNGFKNLYNHIIQLIETPMVKNVIHDSKCFYVKNFGVKTITNKIDKHIGEFNVKN